LSLPEVLFNSSTREDTMSKPTTIAQLMERLCPNYQDDHVFKLEEEVDLLQKILADVHDHLLEIIQDFKKKMEELHNELSKELSDLAPLENSVNINQRETLGRIIQRRRLARREIDWCKFLMMEVKDKLISS
jgi:hypothetical protein